MSKEIEQRVVQMEFDNKNFENNVKTSMSTLDKLKQSLNFGNASKGLAGLTIASKELGSEKGLGCIGNAAETLKLKFSALQIMGITALANITNAAIHTGTQMVKALTIDPIKTGFQEYETQINAVQTILANTESKGSTLNDVNNALNELNTYADKTIYNFTEMTRNIGTFTAAGVELDTSVQAIKGIANLAAVSGSSAQQASVAMYQLSQALASGTVKLMDWNSVVNAGMGGQVFQDSLKETARVHGIAIDDMINKEGSFRETLQNGWLTSEILTETLSKFTGDLSEAQLKSMGYTDEQIKGIMKLGATANDAATKVKTFTQLFDTLKEAAQSGWTKTWELIVGDFGEAKELLTNISNVVGSVIQKMSDARNNLLASGLSSGWKQYLDMGIADEAGYVEEIKAVAKNHNIAVDDMIEKAGSFEKTLKTGWLTSNIMAESLENLTKKTEGLSDEQLEELGYTREQIDNLEALNESVKNGTINIEDLADSMTKVSGRENLIRSLSNTFKFLASVIKPIGEAFREVFPSITGEQLYSFTEKLRAFTEKFKLSEKTIQNIKKTFMGLFAPFKLIGKVVIGLIKFVFNLASNLGGLGNAILSVTGAIGGWISNFVKALDNTDLLAKSLNILQKMFGGLIGVIGDFTTSAGDAFSNLSDGLSQTFLNIDFTKTFDIISSGMLTAITVFIAKFVKKFTDGFGEAFKNVGKLGGIKDILNDVRGCLEAYQQNLKAKALLQIAIAIGILALSISILSTIDAAGLAKALGAMTVMFGELMVAMQTFTLIGAKINGVLKAIPMMIALSIAILILAAALKVISNIDAKDIAKSLVAIGILMGELLLFLKVANFKGLTLASIGLISLGISLLILSQALKQLGSMKWKEILKGLAGMAGVLAILATALRFMPLTTAVSGAGLIIVAAALIILAKALQMFGSMELTSIEKGLIAIGLCLTILAVGLNFMKSTIPGSIALLIAATSLAILTPILKSLGNMKWSSIVKGLVALAGVFLVIGIAGLALTPLVGTLLALSGAFLLFGLSILAIGTGVMLIGVGLTAIAAGFAALALSAAAGATALVAAIKIIMVGLVDMIPDIIGSLKEGVYALADLFKECAPALAASLLVFIVEVINALATYTPQIVDGLMTFFINIINALAAKMPELMASVVNLFASIFTGLADALGKLNPDVVLKALLSVGVLLALMVALSAITSFIPGAMVGLIGVGLVLAEMALIIAALGALSQIDGLEWLMSEGGNFLATLGTAIGQFIGGIAGGIASGISNSLPQIADNLSIFMDKLKPFIDGAKEIDASMLEGVKTLSSVILTLTASSLLNAVSNFLTGGNSLADFAKQLVPFGQSLKSYSETVKGIDSSAISESATAAKALVKVAESIPNSGGVAGFFAGNNDIGSFGDKLVPFGEGLKKYSESVKGIDADSISNSATAAKALIKVANSIPNSGGVAGFFAGNNDISSFGDKLVPFGEGLKKYAEKVSGIDYSAISSSAKSIKTLVSTLKTLTNVDASGVTKFKNAISSLSKTDMSGFVNTFKSVDMTSIGSGFANSLSKGFTSGSSNLSSAASSIAKSLTSALRSQQSSVMKSGQNLLNAFIKGYLSGRGKLISATNSLMAQLPVIITRKYSEFYRCGQFVTEGVARGIRNKIPSVRSAVNALINSAKTTFTVSLRIHSPSRVTTGYGENTGQGFVNGLLNLIPKVMSASSAISETAKKGLVSAVSNLSRIVDDGINSNPTIRPVLDLSNVKSGASALNSLLSFDNVGVLATANSIEMSMNESRQNGFNNEIVDAINKLGDNLNSSEVNSVTINGITYDDGSAISDAVKSIVRAARIERRR